MNSNCRFVLRYISSTSLEQKKLDFFRNRVVLEIAICIVSWIGLINCILSHTNVIDSTVTHEGAFSIISYFALHFRILRFLSYHVPVYVYQELGLKKLIKSKKLVVPFLSLGLVLLANILILKNYN
jgi:hypothetical protein